MTLLPVILIVSIDNMVGVCVVTSASSANNNQYFKVREMPKNHEYINPYTDYLTFDYYVSDTERLIED